MLKKLTINLETNIIEDILVSLETGARRKVILDLKTTLLNKKIKIPSGKDIPTCAEENLTLKEVKTIILNVMHLMPEESVDTNILKAQYLAKRIDRISGGDSKLKKVFEKKLLKSLIQHSLVDDEEIKEWKKLSSKERRKEVLFHAANSLDYLDLENVFISVLEPKASLTDIVKEARNIDAIKNMKNSEILPFLQRLITHEKEIPGTDIKEVIETVIEYFISDHHYYRIAATKYFSLSDLYNILDKCIGLPDRRGKIGQKAAGMILAHKILTSDNDEYINKIQIPDSVFLTSDVFFECLYSNQYNFSSLKHRLKEGFISELELEEEYPRIKKLIMETVIPDIIRIELRELLLRVGTIPLIIRSSSLLEDSVSAFSGKYDSFFFANQPLLDVKKQDRELEEQDLELRLNILIDNILKVYASVLRPEALIYRRERGLLDVDERMSVLIQKVKGERYGKYYFPSLSGVGLSYNNNVNTEKIKWNDPVLRIGVGLGTGIVDIKGARVKVIYPGNPDYTTILNFYEILKTSQRNVDVLNLENDEVETITKEELFTYINENSEKDENSKKIIKIMGKYFLSTIEQDYLKEGIGLETRLNNTNHIFTLEGIKNTKFYTMTNNILRQLSEKYNPVDIEFVVDFIVPDGGISDPNIEDYNLTIVQCRLLTGSREFDSHEMPADLPEENIITLIKKGVINSYVPNIDYVVYVIPEKYFQLDRTRMNTVARIIGQINYTLARSRFILIGPGRWGSSIPHYGIKVSYSEIYHTLALVEVMKMLSDESFTEPSVGSHFGNDVREGSIVTMSVYPDIEGTIFRHEALVDSPNMLGSYFKGTPLEGWVEETVHLVETKSLNPQKKNRDNQVLHLISNAEDSLGMMFIGERENIQKTSRVNPSKLV